MTPDPASRIVPVLGRIPSGIYILTARHGPRETGMLASWVMQAGFQPPSISVAIGRERYLCQWLVEGCPFNLCVVAEHQKALLRHFGRGFAPEAPAFEGLAIDHDPRGVPILREGTLGHLACVTTGHVESGDHRIFIAEVIDGSLHSDALAMVHHRKSGLHY